MQNPLNNLPMFNQAVPQGTFGRAFVRGAGSGALMMGIFSGLSGVSAMLFGFGTPFGWGMLGMMAIGSLATGVFSGVTASQRAIESVNSASNVSHHAARREPIRAPEQAVAHSVNQAAHNQSAWVDRVSANRASGHDRVSQIIADRSLSDGDRAAAILREREQSSTLEAQR